MRHSFNNQLFYEFKSAAFGYPRFIYSGSDLKKIPVFVYHTIDPDLFDSHLKYLKENNYETLSIKDFLNLSGKSFTNNNKVLITIDDARSSVWRYAYPLLKKYGMKASVFVIAGLTVDSPFRRLNLEEAWKGRTSLDRIYEIDPQDNTLCSWEELSDMYHSGLIDIESHTLFHREAFINHKIEDYISHSTSISAYRNPTSAYLSTEDIG